MTTKEAQTILAAIALQIKATEVRLRNGHWSSEAVKASMEMLEDYRSRAAKIENHIRNQATADPPEVITLTDDSGRVIVAVDPDPGEGIKDAWILKLHRYDSPRFELVGIWIGKDNALAAARKFFEEEAGKRPAPVDRPGEVEAPNV